MLKQKCDKTLFCWHGGRLILGIFFRDLKFQPLLILRRQEVSTCKMLPRSKRGLRPKSVNTNPLTWVSTLDENTKLILQNSCKTELGQDIARFTFVFDFTFVFGKTTNNNVE